MKLGLFLFCDLLVFLDLLLDELNQQFISSVALLGLLILDHEVSKLLDMA